MASKKIRVIARLDVKNNYLVKGIQLEGLRKMGDPHDFALRYYDQGIDELLYMDIVASLYNRNNLSDIVRKTTGDVFIPITVGGGLRSVQDVRDILSQGADKVAVNTAAIKDPAIITQVANTFGSQCMVLGIEAKRRRDAEGWEAYYDNGREHSGLDAVEWAKRGEELGAGEILLTSVDREGMEKGMDTALIQQVCGAVNIPVIVSGGCAGGQNAAAAANAGAGAVAVASLLHYGKTDVPGLKAEIAAAGVEGAQMTVTIVDYGLSNLLSVQRAVAKLGGTPVLANTPEQVLAAEALILPGVGAFKDGMAGLDRLGLIEPLRQKAAAGTPLLGICLGMQMLFEESDEFGLHKGLGLIPGRVEKIPAQAADGSRQRVPQVGWNGLHVPKGQKAFAGPLLAATAPGSEVYFVHSYEAKPMEEADRLADCKYGGRRLCAAAGRGSVVGTQFHPEKSGEVGLAILASFLKNAEARTL